MTILNLSFIEQFKTFCFEMEMDGRVIINCNKMQLSSCVSGILDDGVCAVVEFCVQAC